MAKASGNFHIPCLQNGKDGADAVFYEIVPDTYAVSLDADGNWTSGVSVDDAGCALVPFRVIETTGSKKEDVDSLDFVYYGDSRAETDIDSGKYIAVIGKSADTVNLSAFGTKIVTVGGHKKKIQGDLLARCTITVNRAGSNGTSAKIQFSADGASWHDTYQSGDIYMRVYNGSSWSSAIKFVGSNGTSFTPKGTANGHFDKASNISTSFAFWGMLVDTNDKYSPITSSPCLIEKLASGYRVTKASVGDAYVVEGNVWVCSTDVWVNLGNIKGADGSSVYIEETKVTYGISASPKDPTTVKTWLESIQTVTSSEPYLWTKTYVLYSDGTETTSYSVATRGNRGAVFRQHDGFVDGDYNYQSGSGTEEFIDVVRSDSGVWYRCIKSYNSTSVPTANSLSNTTYWSTNGMSNMQFIATELLLAQNATINMMGTNEINLYDGDARFGSFRVPHGDAGVDGDADSGKYALWLGGETGGYAPFSVTHGGALYSTSGMIGGFTIGTNNLHAEKGEMTFDIYNDHLAFVDNNNYRTVMIANSEDDGLSVSLSEREENRMCKMTVGNNSADGNKTDIGLFVTSTGYKSAYAQKCFYIGDYFGKNVMDFAIFGANSYGSSVRVPKPDVGVRCWAEERLKELYLILAGLPQRDKLESGTVGQVYVDNNGFLKIKL